MLSSRSHLIRQIVSDFATRHVRQPRVFLPGRKLERQALESFGISPIARVAAPDVVIHDQERDWFFLFDAVESRRHMDESRQQNLATQFAPCGKGLFFSLLSKIAMPTGCLRIPSLGEPKSGSRTNPIT